MSLGDSSIEEGAYNDWMRAVNEQLVETIGLASDEIMDMPWRDWFDAGDTVEIAVSEALEEAGFGEFA